MFGKQKLIQPLLRHLVKRYLCKAIRNEAAILSCFVIKSTFLQVTREIKFVDNGLSFHQKIVSKRMHVSCNLETERHFNTIVHRNNN